MRYSILLLAMVCVCHFSSAQTAPTNTTFSQLPIVSPGDAEWFVLLSGNPKVWKKVSFPQVRDYMVPNVREVTNGTGLASLTRVVTGDIVVKTTKDSVWFRTTTGWLGVAIGGGGGSGGTLSSVLTAGNNAGSLRITNLGTPVSSTDAATKGYVDTREQVALDTAFARMTRYVRDNGSSSYNGNRAITRSGQFQGLNPGTTTTIQAFLDEVFYPALPPSISLSGLTLNRELMSAGANLSETVNWSVTRASNGGAIVTTTVAGSSVTAAPAAGATATGSTTVSLTRNTNQAITGTTTDANGKTASATLNVAWLPSRYFGMSATGLNNSLTSELSSTQVKGQFFIALTGVQSSIVYAYPASLPALTSFIVNGLESIDVFAVTTVNHTNASGHTQLYRVYTSVNTFSGSGNITVNQVQ